MKDKELPMLEIFIVLNVIWWTFSGYYISGDGALIGFAGGVISSAICYFIGWLISKLMKY